MIHEGFTKNSKRKNIPVSRVFSRVRAHDFNPLNEDNSLTVDRNLKVVGIADLDDADWRVRLLAIRDLVRAGSDKADEITEGLKDTSVFVRQVSAMALGILRAQPAIPSLEKAVREDENTMVRAQAVIALGQIESEVSLDLLRKKLEGDPSRDVRHQCELAIDQIKKKMGTTTEQLNAFLNLNESLFEIATTGSRAPNFHLEDTDGKTWELNDFRSKKWVVLIWVFADWCPVCHGEFHDLMKMQDEFEGAGIKVFTVETHDRYRGRVLVGQELNPEYWFSEESFQQAYTEQIRWPHLLDSAGAVGAMYGVDPLAFAVHAEYINRPTTVVIDKDGIIRLLYRGTYWGDRPTIEQTLDMIKNEDFSFVHPERLKAE